MSNTDTVLEYLDGISPSGACDDAISEALSIKPRQQVNQIANRLAAEHVIVRRSSRCPHCAKTKLVNTYVKRDRSSHTLAVRESAYQPYAPAPPRTPQAPLALSAVADFYRIRGHLVRFCRELWKATSSSSLPQGVSPLISALREARVVPAHQANLMLSICGLRNVLEYEGLEFGDREYLIGGAAWSIVAEWAEASYPDLWRLTTR